MSHRQKGNTSTIGEHPETDEIYPAKAEFTAEDVAKIMAGLTIAIVVVVLIVITFLLKNFAEN